MNGLGFKYIVVVRGPVQKWQHTVYLMSTVIYQIGIFSLGIIYIYRYIIYI